MNYYERHLGDYAKDTGHLTMVEHGAYTLLLDRYYSTEAPIPADQAHRVARARTKDEKDAVDAVLAEFFLLSDAGWTHRRADEELAKARVRIDAAKENGKRGGRPRKNPVGYEKETQQKPGGFPVGSVSETQSKAHQTPDTKQEQKQKAPPAAPVDFKADLFARWKATPGSGGAAFLSKLFRDHGPEQRVLEAVERTLDHEPADVKAFVLGVLRRESADESAHDALMARAI